MLYISLLLIHLSIIMCPGILWGNHPSSFSPIRTNCLITWPSKARMGGNSSGSEVGYLYLTWRNVWCRDGTQVVVVSLACLLRFLCHNHGLYRSSFPSSAKVKECEWCRCGVFSYWNTHNHWPLSLFVHTPRRKCRTFGYSGLHLYNMAKMKTGPLQYM